MRYHFFQNYWLAGAFALSCLFFPLQAQAVSSTILSVDPSNSTVFQGEQVHVDVTISGLGNMVAPSVGGFELTISFDKNILSLNSVMFGTFLGGPAVSVSGSDDTISGQVTIFDLSKLSATNLDAQQPDSGVLATLWFNSIGTGTTALTLTETQPGVSVVDSTGNAITNLTLNSGSATVEQNPIPEPSTLLLMATGSMGLLAWRRWKK